MEKTKKPVYKKWWFWLIVILIIGSVGNSMDKGEAPTDVKTEETSKAQETEKPKEKETKQDPAEEKATYIVSAKEYKYKDLERNPDEYKGEIGKFTGQVIQVSEGFLNNVVYRVNVTRNPEYDEESFLEDEWIDTIYVSYKRSEGEQRILEDDIISIYGELDGMETYTSVLSGRISIPSVKAKYIDIVETAESE